MDGEGRPTALIVDDYSDSRRVLRRMLELRHFRVSEAAGGDEAVESAGRACPDLILMDMIMPGTGGPEAARRIRGLGGECARVVLIAYTAFDAPGLREAAIEAGFDDYLVKPFGFGELDAALRRHPPPLSH